IPTSNRMVQAAPTISFKLPKCSAAHVKVRYSAVVDYPAGVFGSYSPAVGGDPGLIRWGFLATGTTSVDVAGTWMIALDENGYGNVYPAGTGSIWFQGAPGRDTVFGNGFD